MENTAETKAWGTPVLTVLVRSRPEEDVLNLCKHTAPGVGEHDAAQTCQDTSGACQECAASATS